MSHGRVWFEQLAIVSTSLALLLNACGGGSNGPAPFGASSSDAAGAGTAGSPDSTGSAGNAGSVAGAAGLANAGQSGAAEAAGAAQAGASGSTGGASGSTGGTSGAGGASAAGSAGATGGSAPVLTTKDFQCSELIGLWVASQWWGSFEQGVDNAHWEFMFQHHGYLEMFADPASPFWANSVSSKCSSGATTPDRVVFLPFSLTLNTLEQWTSNLKQVVETMKGKFPGVKRIEFMTTLRSPGNVACANDTDPNTVVPAYVDQAIQAVADASGGLVTVGAKIELGQCNWWAGGTDLTGAGNTGAGQLLATYYQTH